MTPQQLQLHKQSVKEALERNLRIDKLKPTGPYRADSLMTITETVVIPVDTKDALSDVTTLHNLLLQYPNATVKIEPKTVYEYCDRKFVGTIYSVQYTKLRDFIEDYQVTDKVKLYVRNCLGLGKYDALECKIMDLFKQGKVSWDDVVEAHKKDCSL